MVSVLRLLFFSQAGERSRGCSVTVGGSDREERDRVQDRGGGERDMTGKIVRH